MYANGPRYEDQLFGFASQEFLNWFAASPQEYMDAVMLQAIQYPACIALLNLQSCFPELSLDKLIASVALEAVTCDGECQTEVHPVAKHIDSKYEWNEWEHRRKALAMVNLRQKRTHGSQTILSHFRRENATQVWLLDAASAWNCSIRASTKGLHTLSGSLRHRAL